VTHGLGLELHPTLCVIVIIHTRKAAWLADGRRLGVDMTYR
jgi:hypothetical protein